MPECVMLIALAKILAEKRCDFIYPSIRLSAPPYTPRLPTIKAPPKSNVFCFPLYGLSHKAHNI